MKFLKFPKHLLPIIPELEEQRFWSGQVFNKERYTFQVLGTGERICFDVDLIKGTVTFDCVIL